MADIENRLQALEHQLAQKDEQITRLQKNLYALSAVGKPVDEWDFFEVGNWLDQIHLGSYKPIFKENEIDGDTLLSFDESFLKDLIKPFHVKKFMKQLNILRKPRTHPVTHPPAPVSDTPTPTLPPPSQPGDQKEAEARVGPPSKSQFDARPMVQTVYEPNAELTDPDGAAYNVAVGRWYAAKPKMREEDENNPDAQAALEWNLANWERQRIPPPTPGELPGMDAVDSEPAIEHLEIDKGTPDEWVKRSPELIRLAGKFPLNAEASAEKLMESWITPNAYHNVRNHGKAATTKWETHTLTIDGMVDRRLEISMDELTKRFPSETFPALLVCAGHRRKEQNILKKSKGFNSQHCLGNSEWTGVPLYKVLEAAGVQKDAVFVNFEGTETLPGGKFGASLHINKAMNPTQDVILAYKMNGEDLPYDHGFPLRVIFPGQVAGRWVKWLCRITVSDHESDSHYWWDDNRVWPPMTDTTTIAQWKYRSEYVIMELCIQSLITAPGYDEVVSTEERSVLLKGYAFSGGGRKLMRVEVTLDDGEIWKAAKIHRHEKARHKGMCHWAWVWWELSVDMSQLQNAEFVSVRAFDDSINTQPERMTWSALGMYNNSWYRIKLDKTSNGIKFIHPVHQYGGERPLREHAKLTQGGWLTEYADASVKSALPMTEGKETPDTTDAATTSSGKTFTRAEVAKHSSKDDCWITISGKVYDVTEYCLKNGHAGGSQIIWMSKGRDATEGWDSIDHSAQAAQDLAPMYVGDLKG